MSCALPESENAFCVMISVYSEMEICHPFSFACFQLLLVKFLIYFPYLSGLFFEVEQGDEIEEMAAAEFLTFFSHLFV